MLQGTGRLPSQSQSAGLLGLYNPRRKHPLEAPHRGRRSPPPPAPSCSGSGELQTNVSAERRQQGGARFASSGLDNLVSTQDGKLRLQKAIMTHQDTIATAADTPLAEADRCAVSIRHSRQRGMALYTANDLDFDGHTQNHPRDNAPHVCQPATKSSVQQTLYAMAESALEEVNAIDEIEISMPNKHCLLVDLSRFGQEQPERNLQCRPMNPTATSKARVRRKP